MSQFQFLLDEIVEASCPELQRTPVYVVEEHSDDPYTHGYTSRWPLPRQEAELKRAGRWRGDGFICVIHPHNIHSAMDPDQQHRFGEMLRQFFGHELCHLLPSVPPLSVFGNDPSDDDIALVATIVEKKRKAAPAIAPEVYPWSADHGWTFIRRCIHVWHRCDRAGIKFPLHDMAAGFQYSLSNIEHYHRALGSEPQRMMGADFATILRQPAPDAFIDVWQSDMDFYSAMQADREKRLAKQKEKRA